MAAVMAVLGAVPNRPGGGRETYVHGRFFRFVYELRLQRACVQIALANAGNGQFKR